MVRPTLYIKAGCPWCIEAEDFLQQHAIAYDLKEVRQDPIAFQEMRDLSGQTKAPTLDWAGEILADFGADELEQFLRQKKII